MPADDGNGNELCVEGFKEHFIKTISGGISFHTNRKPHVNNPEEHLPTVATKPKKFGQSHWHIKCKTCGNRVYHLKITPLNIENNKKRYLHLWNILNDMDRKLKQQRPSDDQERKPKKQRPTDPKCPNKLRPSKKEAQSSEMHGEGTNKTRGSPDKHVTLSRYIAFRIIFDNFVIMYDKIANKWLL